MRKQFTVQGNTLYLDILPQIMKKIQQHKTFKQKN